MQGWLNTHTQKSINVIYQSSRLRKKNTHDHLIDAEKASEKNPISVLLANENLKDTSSI